MPARLVVEWTRATLRVAVAEGRGPNVRLRTVRSQPIEAAADPTEPLRELLRAVRAPRAEVIGVIPREQVLTRVVQFPSAEAAELAQMVGLYAKAQLPYPGDQVIVDFQILSQQEGFSTVMLVACQRETIERMLAVLRGAGLSPSSLTVSAWGVLGWYQRALQVDASREPTLAVVVDDTRTDLVLIGQGRVLSSRSVGQGAQDWAASGESMELLAAEIERSQAAIRKELPGAEIQSLVLSGVGDLLAWRDALADRLRFSVTVIESAGPFADVQLVSGAPISLAAIGGVACSLPHTLLNLAPPSVRAQVEHHRQVWELAAIGSLLLAVLLGGSLVLGLQAVRQREVAEQFDRVVKSAEPRAKRLQEATRSVQTVRALLDERRRLAQLLADVFRVSSQKVSLETLAFERGKRELTLRGSAPSTQAVLGYVQELERLGGVAGVTLKYSAQRAVSTGDRTTFELVLQQQEPVS